MIKVLANDGISQIGKDYLEKLGFEVFDVKVAQNQLSSYINQQEIVALIVRSATKVTKEIIDSCPGLRFIGRGGVGMDNIDVSYAESKGIKVVNTPNASSQSVAELVFAHLFNGVRSLQELNRLMPLEGDTNFKGLKDTFGNGRELRGKTLGIVGFGRIGKAVAKIALSVGMDIVVYDLNSTQLSLELSFFDGRSISFDIKPSTKDDIVRKSDFITIHIPKQNQYLFSEEDFINMKDGVGIVNVARGGVLDEALLLKYIENGKVSFAGVDVFENEPNPWIKLLMTPKVSLSPHIGASTQEAQDRISVELANELVEFFYK